VSVSITLWGYLSISKRFGMARGVLLNVAVASSFFSVGPELGAKSAIL
jgi:hypothetical protein